MRFENKGIFITFGVGYFTAIKRVGVLILLSIVGVLASAQTNTLTLTNTAGQVYSNAVVVKIEADDVLFRLEDWQYARVNYTNMPVSIQAQFASDRENIQQAQEVKIQGQQPVDETTNRSSVAGESPNQEQFVLDADDIQEIQNGRLPFSIRADARMANMDLDDLSQN